MLDSSYYTQVDTILQNYPAGERSLIPVIQDIRTADSSVLRAFR